MSQFNYIDFILDVNGNILESNLTTITQHSTNTIVRILSAGLTVDSVFLSFKDVEGAALPKKLALLQPTLLDGKKVWQYRLTESDTALANPSPSPFKLTISLKKNDITNQLPEQTLTMVRSLESAIVIPESSSLDGISDGFNAVSEEILRLDELRASGITNVIDNQDGTVTIVYDDNELRTSNLTGPQGAVGPAGPPGADGEDGEDAVLGPDLTAIESLNGTGYLTRTGENLWALVNLDADITAISGLDGTGLLRRTGVNTWALDTNEYISSLSVSAPLTISGTGNNRTIAINAVSQSNAGVMGIADKVKLDGIATNANNYLHPTGFTLDTTILSGASVISRIAVNDNGHVTAVSTRTLIPDDINAAAANHSHGIITSNGFTTEGLANRVLSTTTNGQINTREIVNATSSAPIGTSSTNLLTESRIYHGLSNINDVRQSSSQTIYAPTTTGTAGLVLKWPEGSSSVPVWGPAVSGAFSSVLLLTATWTTGPGFTYNPSGGVDYSAYKTLIIQYTESTGGFDFKSSVTLPTVEMTSTSRGRLIVSRPDASVSYVTILPNGNLADAGTKSVTFSIPFTPPNGTTVKIYGLT